MYGLVKIANEHLLKEGGKDESEKSKKKTGVTPGQLVASGAVAGGSAGMEIGPAFKGGTGSPRRFSYIPRTVIGGGIGTAVGAAGAMALTPLFKKKKEE